MESNELWQSKGYSCTKLHVNLAAAFGTSVSERDEAAVSRIPQKLQECELFMIGGA